MDLSNLKAPGPNRKNRKRVGRGQGSGHGGHTVGRGHNGQKSRTGYNHKSWFEGGQMPLQRRIPKFGFKNRNRTEYRVLNVEVLSTFVSENKLNATVTIEDLKKAGLLGKKEKIKLLGNGDIDKKVEIEVHAASSSGRKKVEEAGGSVTIVNY